MTMAVDVGSCFMRSATSSRMALAMLVRRADPISKWISSGRISVGTLGGVTGGASGGGIGAGAGGGGGGGPGGGGGAGEGGVGAGGGGGGGLDGGGGGGGGGGPHSAPCGAARMSGRPDR